MINNYPRTAKEIATIFHLDNTSATKGCKNAGQIIKIIKKLKLEMPKKSSITLFIAATSALAISSSVNSGENDMGGLKEWNTDMDVNADFVLDKEAQKLADEAAKSSTCIPIKGG
jgi:hypothetical protein